MKECSILYFEEKVLGHAKSVRYSRLQALVNIAGSYVHDGVFERGCMVRI